MTEREKQTEVDTLISEPRDAGKADPKKSDNLIPADLLRSVLADGRRMVDDFDARLGVEPHR